MNNNQDYQKNYRKSYKEKNKIISFPLNNAFYEEIKRRAIYLDVTPNSYVKHIINSYLNNTPLQMMSAEKKDYISEYIQISRGIATNINQIAHKTNIEAQIDIQILLSSLRRFEDEFKDFIKKQ
jgi:hypothetical protein